MTAMKIYGLVCTCYWKLVTVTVTNCKEPISFKFLSLGHSWVQHNVYMNQYMTMDVHINMYINIKMMSSSPATSIDVQVQVQLLDFSFVLLIISQCKCEIYN